MGGPVKPGGSQRKKKDMEMGWELCDRRRGLVGAREELDRRAGDQSASHTCVTRSRNKTHLFKSK